MEFSSESIVNSFYELDDTNSDNSKKSLSKSLIETLKEILSDSLYTSFCKAIDEYKYQLKLILYSAGIYFILSLVLLISLCSILVLLLIKK